MRKNSRAASQRSDHSHPQKKNIRLVKESQLHKSLGRGVSSGSRTQDTPNTVRGDKGSLSADISAKLSHALIPHKLGITYTLNKESTPTSITELLRNHIFGSSPDTNDPRFLGTVCHLVKFSAQSEASSSKLVEKLFADSKRQALLVLSLFIYFTDFCCPYYVNCLSVFAGP